MGQRERGERDGAPARRVLGIAILVAIVGDATGRGALGEFHAGWAFIALAAGFASAVASALTARGQPTTRRRAAQSYGA